MINKLNMRTVKQRWKTLAFATLVAAGLGNASDLQAAASNQNVMCVKTNTGNYFPVVRVSMMVIPDGGSTFDILLKDGEGEAGVQSISFEKHTESIDFSLYQTESDGTPYIDMTKPVYLYTNTGKFWLVKELPVMNVQEGTSLIDITVGSSEEKGVSNVFFFRGTEEGLNEAVQTATNIQNPAEAPAAENLTLQTPVSEQMQISGCGNASVAIVYALDGKEQAQAPVANGCTTVYVGHLTPGVYVLRVGNKAMKFIKK